MTCMLLVCVLQLKVKGDKNLLEGDSVKPTINPWRCQEIKQ